MKFEEIFRDLGFQLYQIMQPVYLSIIMDKKKLQWIVLKKLFEVSILSL
jgi:hypothetical protein